MLEARASASTSQKSRRIYMEVENKSKYIRYKKFNQSLLSMRLTSMAFFEYETVI